MRACIGCCRRDRCSGSRKLRVVRVRVQVANEPVRARPIHASVHFGKPRATASLIASPIIAGSRRQSHSPTTTTNFNAVRWAGPRRGG